MADTPDLGSGAFGLGSSSLPLRTLFTDRLSSLVVPAAILSINFLFKKRKGATVLGKMCSVPGANWRNTILKGALSMTYAVGFSSCAKLPAPPRHDCRAPRSCDISSLVADELLYSTKLSSLVQRTTQQLQLRIHELIPPELDTSLEVINSQGSLTLLRLMNQKLPSFVVSLKGVSEPKVFHIDDFCRNATGCSVSAVRLHELTGTIALLLEEKANSRITLINAETGASRDLPLPNPYDMSWAATDDKLYITAGPNKLPSVLFVYDLSTSSISKLYEKEYGQIQLQTVADPNWLVCTVLSKDTAQIFAVASRNDSSRLVELFHDVQPGQYTWNIIRNRLYFTDRLRTPSQLDARDMEETEIQHAHSLFPRDILLDKFEIDQERLVSIVRKSGKPCLGFTSLQPKLESPKLWCPADWGSLRISTVQGQKTPLTAVYSAPRTPPLRFSTNEPPTEAGEIPGFKVSRFQLKTAHVTIPATILRRLSENSAAPTLLRFYGAYGTPLDPEFSPYDLVLAQNGITVVYAHLRGGGEFGPAWHLSGRGKGKERTVDDLLMLTDALVREGVALPDHIVLATRSAGARIGVAALAQAPGRYKGFLFERPHLSDTARGSLLSSQLQAHEHAEWFDETRGNYALPTIQDIKKLPNGILTAGLYDEVTPLADIAAQIPLLRSKLAPDNKLVFLLDKTGDHQGQQDMELNFQEQAKVMSLVLRLLFD